VHQRRFQPIVVPVERIIARVEASAQGTDTRFAVANLSGSSASTSTRSALAHNPS